MATATDPVSCEMGPPGPQSFKILGPQGPQIMQVWGPNHTSVGAPLSLDEY